MNKVFTKEWLYAALIRAIRTIAQAAIATIGTGAMFSQVDWRMVLSTSVVAGILSLLTSLAGLPEVSETPTASKGEIEDGTNAVQSNNSK